MLTNKDIQKLVEVFATKKDLAKLLTMEEFGNFRKEIKQEFSDLREVVQALAVSVDKLAKVVDDLREEYVAITSKIDRHEKWLHQLADKLGIKLEY